MIIVVCFDAKSILLCLLLRSPCLWQVGEGNSCCSTWCSFTCRCIRAKRASSTSTTNWCKFGLSAETNANSTARHSSPEKRSLRLL